MAGPAKLIPVTDDREPYADLHYDFATGDTVELEREVRIEGRAEKVSAQESEEYFNSRPLGSRHAAIASPQSKVVASRVELEARFTEAEKQGDAPARPARWGGYRIVPSALEFWQGRPNRLHDRVLYTRAGDNWKLERLAP